MKAYQLNIFSIKESRATHELSCITKAKSKIEAKKIADDIIFENKDKYNSIKLQSISRLDA